MKNIWTIARQGFDRYAIKALSSMALGLFASLIIGVIIGQIAKIPFLAFLAPFSEIIGAKSPVVGAAIGVAIAHGIGHKPLVIFSSAATGAFGYMAGGPVGAYVGALVGCEIGGLVAGKTKFDIILAPVCTIIPGMLIGQWVGPGVSAFMSGLGQVVMRATELSPLPMGVVVAVIMGLALTAPISSAALAIMLQLSGLAAGASVAGCAAQMVGFAAMSFRENRWSGLVSQGLGTSMLQVPNILRHPLILIPPTVASAICGPVAICIFNMQCDPIGAGMGTSGLVGQLSTYAVMTTYSTPGYALFTILLVHILLPAAISLLCCEFMRKLGWIKYGDAALIIK